jgi:hypothetical protein
MEIYHVLNRLSDCWKERLKSKIAQVGEWCESWWVPLEGHCSYWTTGWGPWRLRKPIVRDNQIISASPVTMSARIRIGNKRSSLLYYLPTSALQNLVLENASLSNRNIRKNAVAARSGVEELHDPQFDFFLILRSDLRFHCRNSNSPAI